MQRLAHVRGLKCNDFLLQGTVQSDLPWGWEPALGVAKG